MREVWVALQENKPRNDAHVHDTLFSINTMESDQWAVGFYHSTGANNRNVARPCKWLMCAVIFLEDAIRSWEPCWLLTIDCYTY